MVRAVWERRFGTVCLADPLLLSLLCHVVQGYARAFINKVSMLKSEQHSASVFYNYALFLLNCSWIGGKGCCKPFFLECLKTILWRSKRLKE